MLPFDALCQNINSFKPILWCRREKKNRGREASWTDGIFKITGLVSVQQVLKLEILQHKTETIQWLVIGNSCERECEIKLAIKVLIRGSYKLTVTIGRKPRSDLMMQEYEGIGISGKVTRSKFMCCVHKIGHIWEILSPIANDLCAFFLFFCLVDWMVKVKTNKHGKHSHSLLTNRGHHIHRNAAHKPGHTLLAGEITYFQPASDTNYSLFLCWWVRNSQSIQHITQLLREVEVIITAGRPLLLFITKFWSKTSEKNSTMFECWIVYHCLRNLISSVI